MTNTVLYGNKHITYSENFWTGKKKITINGQELQKIDKKTYRFEDQYYTVKGSFLTGVEMVNGDRSITLVRKLTALETLLCFLPFVLVVTGGAIGGLCGGAAAAINAIYVRDTEKTVMKVAYSILSTVIAFVCYYILSSIFLMLIL
jgi:hypothetical protein